MCRLFERRIREREKLYEASANVSKRMQLSERTNERTNERARLSCRIYKKAASEFRSSTQICTIVAQFPLGQRKFSWAACLQSSEFLENFPFARLFFRPSLRPSVRPSICSSVLSFIRLQWRRRGGAFFFARLGGALSLWLPDCKDGNRTRPSCSRVTSENFAARMAQAMQNAMWSVDRPGRLA